MYSHDIWQRLEDAKAARNRAGVKYWARQLRLAEQAEKLERKAEQMRRIANYVPLEQQDAASGTRRSGASDGLWPLRLVLTFLLGVAVGVCLTALLLLYCK